MRRSVGIQKGKAYTLDVTPVYDDDKDTQILVMLLLPGKMKHMSLKRGIQEQLFVKYVLQYLKQEMYQVYTRVWNTSRRPMIG